MIPRHLPPGLGARAAVFTIPGFIACLLLLQGQLFAWIFLPMTDVAGLRDWRGPVERGGGVVTDVRATSSTVNERRVMAVEFSHADGRLHGTSYGTGVGLQPGAVVDVEWPAGRPEAARIVGLDRAAMPAWALLPAVLLPLAGGLVAALFAIRTGRRRLYLLRHGRLVRGRVIAREKTRTRVNKRPVYRVRFAHLRDDGRDGEAVVRTHRADALLEGAEATLLTDRDRPERADALLVDQLSGSPRVTEIAVEGTAGALGMIAVALPIAAVAGWLLVAWFMLR